VKYLYYICSVRRLNKKINKLYKWVSDNIISAIDDDPKKDVVKVESPKKRSKPRSNKKIVSIGTQNYIKNILLDNLYGIEQNVKRDMSPEKDRTKCYIKTQNGQSPIYLPFGSKMIKSLIIEHSSGGKIEIALDDKLIYGHKVILGKTELGSIIDKSVQHNIDSNHCSISFNNGHFKLKDEGSMSGTLIEIDGETFYISGNEETNIEAGNFIYIGDERFRADIVYYDECITKFIVIIDNNPENNSKYNKDEFREVEMSDVKKCIKNSVFENFTATINFDLYKEFRDGSIIDFAKGYVSIRPNMSRLAKRYTW
jgi:hypothetical protein